MRTPAILLAAIALAVPLHGQNVDDPDRVVTGGGDFPAGWDARVDRDQPATDVVFVATGDGFRATMGPAAVFYNAAWEQSGDYEIGARFTQVTAPTHPEAYGIAIGGSDLAGPGQQYTYFLVRGTGEYFIANRDGDDRTIEVAWAPHDAVRPQDDAGRQVNELSVRAAGSDVLFLANGTEVARLPRDQVFSEGIFGFRINHNLDVEIDQVRR